MRLSGDESEAEAIKSEAKDEAFVRPKPKI